jgi:hypothetical protein
MESLCYESGDIRVELSHKLGCVCTIVQFSVAIGTDCDRIGDGIGPSACQLPHMMGLQEGLAHFRRTERRVGSTRISRQRPG